jgi:hypothetical protein
VKAAPFQGVFIFPGVCMEPNIVHEPLPIKFVTRLTENDDALIRTFANEIGCTPSQLARYAIRKYLHEKIKEAPEVTGG